MTDSAGERRTRIAELSAAIGLLIWRIVVLPFPGLLRDWVVLLGLYWIFTIFAQRSRSWPWVTLGTMIVLAGIYLRGQFPFTLELLGIRL